MAGWRDEVAAVCARSRARRAARPAGRGAAARPAPDGGDRQGAVPPAHGADPRRADLVADGARGARRCSTCCAACAARASPSSTSRIASTRCCELCEYVTVLKDGTRTADQPLAGSDPHALVRLMVGRQVGDLFPAWQPTVTRRASRSRSRNLRCRGVHGIDLTVRAARSSASAACSARARRKRMLALYGAIARRGRPLHRGRRRRRPDQRDRGQRGAASPMCRPTASATGCCCRCRSAST